MDIMDKDVIISLRGSQSTGNGTSNTLELITEGKYYKRNNAYYITYDESEVTGMEGTTTTVKVEDGVVTFMREGAVNSQFVFQKGHKHISYYDTIHGAFTVGVLANDVNINVNDYGGEISVGYHIEVNNETDYNEFYMSIKEVGYPGEKYRGRNENKY